MKRWAILFGIFLLVIIVLADAGQLGNLRRIYGFPGGDRAGHFVLFGLLSFLIDWALFEEYPSSGRKRLALIATVILLLVVGLEEFSQSFFATRHADVVDYAFSSLGVVIFALLALRLRERAGPAADGKRDPMR